MGPFWEKALRELGRYAWFGLVCVACGWFAAKAGTGADDNAAPRYGASGLPENCRALIAANVQGYRDKAYTADEALGSIERNCGAFGGIWQANR